MIIYKHHMGDFNHATRHLTRLERSIYRDLIELYYDIEGPLPLDVAEVSRKVLAKDEQELTAVEQVLNEFFTKTNGGWFHERCEEEIDAYRNNTSAKAAAGKASAAAKSRRKAEKLAKLQQTGNSSSTDVQQPLDSVGTKGEQNSTNLNPNLNPNLNTESKNTPQAAKADKSARTVTQDHLVTVHAVEPQVAVDYLAIRKAKRAPLTATAFAKLQAEFTKAGLSVPDGIRLCAERGWQGFEAKWLTNGGQTKADDRAAKLEEARRRSQERTGGIRDVTPRSVGNA